MEKIMLYDLAFINLFIIITLPENSLRFLNINQINKLGTIRQTTALNTKFNQPSPGSKLHMQAVTAQIAIVRKR